MKKKTRIIALLLVCVLIACTSASFVSAAEPQYYNYGTVSVEAANFRARPELDEKNVLGTLLKGDRVRILQGVNGDGISWYYVRVATGANANKTGYVSTGCVTLDAVSTGCVTLDAVSTGYATLD